MAERSLVIKVTAGKDDPERCNQAFTVAAAAVASGVPVSLWLTGESAWFGLPGRAEDFSLPHAAPLADLLAGVLAAGHGDGLHAMRRPPEHHRRRPDRRHPDRGCRDLRRRDHDRGCAGSGLLVPPTQMTAILFPPGQTLKITGSPCQGAMARPQPHSGTADRLPVQERRCCSRSTDRWNRVRRQVQPPTPMVLRRLCSRTGTAASLDVGRQLPAPHRVVIRAVPRAIRPAA